MSLPPLKVKIGADTSGLEKGVRDAERELTGLQGATNRIGRGMQDFGSTAQKVGARFSVFSAGVAAVGGGMFALAKGTADAADEIAKTSRAAGVSADALQELRFALGQAAGTGEAETATMLTTLTRRMGEAAAGNDTYADALGRLGVSLEDVASGAIGTDEVFMRLADAMQNAGSDSEAAAMGMELLGRQGAALGGQLRESGADIDALRDRAQELGIVLSGETLDASEAFNDKMDELQKQMGAAKSAIGQALLPAALGLATAFQDKIIPAISQVAEAVAGAIEWFGNLPGPVQEAAGLVAAALGVGGPIVLAVGVLSKVIGGLLVASGPIGLFIAAAGLLYAAWQKWGDDITRVVGDAVDWITDKFNQFVDFIKAIPGQTLEIGKQIISRLIEGIRSGIGNLAQIGADIRDGLVNGIKGAVGSVGDAARGLGASALDGIKGILRSNSPSLAMMEVGQDIGAGLVMGIDESRAPVSEAMARLGEVVAGVAGDEMGEGIGGGFADAVGRFLEFGQQIGANLTQGIRSTFGMVQSAVQGLGDQVTTGAFDMAKGVVDALGQMFQGSKPIAAAQALINTFQGITEALKLPFPQSLAAAARVAAQGFAAVRGIQSARPGAGGAAGGTGGTGGTGGGAPQAQNVATQRVRFEIVGQGAEADAAFRTLQLVQQAIDNGGRLDGLIAERVAG